MFLDVSVLLDMRVGGLLSDLFNLRLGLSISVLMDMRLGGLLSELFNMRLGG